jgi:transposase
MAMGRRKSHTQSPLFVIASDLPRSAAHPFYNRLNHVLAEGGFDPFVEELCAKFYNAKPVGRPSLEPGKYFRLLLLGYFEGIDSERGIAWRCADSLSLRAFVGYGLDEMATEHSTISRTRRLIDLETHQAVFTWVLKLLAQNQLLKGKTVGIDATTLEANAAMRSIVRNDTGESYEQFLTGLAKASGIETPTREDLARIDKKRKNKASNDDWHNPHEPDAKIAKMKDGSTHLAHKQEHAVDMESGAILAVTIQPADEGDTTTWRPTVEETYQNLNAVREDPQAAEHLHPNSVEELVEDKGYHSNQTMSDLKELEIRTYVSEPNHGRRDWQGKDKERDAVYANRRRIRSPRGKRLMRKRGELIERSFAHVLETGGMRRTHLRGHLNILKRMLVHVGGFNLGLVMRKLTGSGKPRRLQGLFPSLYAVIWALLNVLVIAGRQFCHRALQNQPLMGASKPATAIAFIYGICPVRRNFQ